MENPAKVYLVGNPNAGKTTLFNALTGLHHKVANYPGVTVERREAIVTLPGGRKIVLVDLPGTYSLQGSSLDEQLVLKTITDDPPSLILAIVDSTHLARHLFLATQVLDLKIRTLLVLTMKDEAETLGIKIHKELLKRELGCSEVVFISAKKGKGLEQLLFSIERALTALPIKTTVDAQISHTDDDVANRYASVSRVVSLSVDDSRIQKGGLINFIDSLLVHRYWGFLILVLVFGLMFQSIFVFASFPMDLIERGVSLLSQVLREYLAPGPMTSLLVDGVVAGVGNVLIFLPQIVILFVFLSILEDCGYLARGAFLLDSFMRGFGLQGRAFIPLLSSFACAIPGIMATRTIPSRGDRFTTIMVAPLISCSARLPVYAVLIAAFVPPVYFLGFFSVQGIVLFSLYLIGVLGALVVARILRGTVFRSESSLFVMEIPPLRRPSVRVVFRSVYDAASSFLWSASTIILACSVVVWFLASYPEGSVEESYAGQFGKFIEPAIRPLGFDWRIGFAIFSSLPAREVFITGLSTIYSLSDQDPEHGGVIGMLKSQKLSGGFSTATGLSLLVFYVFACQCISTLAVCRRETGSWWWSAAMFGYMTALAYLSAFLTYQLSVRILQ